METKRFLDPSCSGEITNEGWRCLCFFSVWKIPCLTWAPCHHWENRENPVCSQNSATGRWGHREHCFSLWQCWPKTSKRKVTDNVLEETEVAITQLAGLMQLYLTWAPWGKWFSLFSSLLVQGQNGGTFITHAEPGYEMLFSSLCTDQNGSWREERMLNWTVELNILEGHLAHLFIHSFIHSYSFLSLPLHREVRAWKWTDSDPAFPELAV